MKRHPASLLLPFFALLFSCATDAPTSRPEDSVGELMETIARYDNDEFNDYSRAGASSIDNQWARGLSSPYILRFDGAYYLYCSTTDLSNQNGIRAWKSADLLHWAPVQSPNLPRGYVTEKTLGATLNARAPEVHYSNGEFYMYESFSDGTGHFVLKSSSPEGPFTPLTSSPVDTFYDGTVFFGTHENPFFLTAGKGAINVSTMESMSSLIATQLPIASTASFPSLYQESPAVFESNGKYYLLYSSSHDDTGGYQTSYVVSEGWKNEIPSDMGSSFLPGESSYLLRNGDKEKGPVGLGHPSVVLGPDLDSHYVVYDSLDDDEPVRRSMGIDRLFVDEGLLSVAPTAFGGIAPSSPAFSGDRSDFVRTGSFLLSNQSSSPTFTAEFNFKNAEKSSLVFAYRDEANYSFLRFDARTGLRLGRVENGEESIAKEIDFYSYLSNDALHTITVAVKDNLLDLHFEGSLKLHDFPFPCEGGKVGYLEGEGLDIHFTSFSNFAKGSSDQAAIKAAEMEIPAASFMGKGQISGTVSHYFSSDEPISLPKEEGKIRGSMLHLKPYDFARYLVDFPSSRDYGFVVKGDASLRGKTILLQVDGLEEISFAVPYFETEEGEVTVSLGGLCVEKGVHQIKIQSGEKDISYSSFTFYPRDNETGVSLSASLADEQQTRGLRFGGDSRWVFRDSKMVSFENYRNIAYTEESGIDDFNLSVDFALTGSDSIFSESSYSGVIFRASSYVSYAKYLSSHSDLDMWNARMKQVQGYAISFTTRKIRVSRYDIGKETIFETREFAIGGKKNHALLVKGRGNVFDLFLDGKFILRFIDPNALPSGRVGLYATGAEIAYSNLKIQTA